ncbi:MAG: pseudouridine synthase [Owenweeksia sp.]|nr:pseudouridine synthase [Owenweeksia sp.]MBF99415.1 pseudouridine synthase [Owenweeksia sp.]HBF21793.1 rRNA pseudouridine synthase [Cryomorphaceae bacterium]HCQ15145.1 rRNA pseudouridine synthase [Cryomorphaceae bacterium]|tara:strand:- start:12315 stop:13130 length:816 start_codon:yes stop_codon:yes gene_type:complete
MQKRGPKKSPGGRPQKPIGKKKPAGSGPKPSPSNDGTMRLNKFLAHSGIASRREADDLIKAGLVEVNGKTITEMGFKVKPADEVRFNGSEIRKEKKVYLVLNKPKGFITTTDDPKARKTVMELVGNAGSERFYPVGRLDRKTTGVLLFTNDGDLAKKLTHPSHGARKIYEVGLDKNLTKTDFHKIQDGLELEDGPIKVDEIQYIEGKSKNNIGIVIHSGRNRIVRRIFESLEYEVTKLDRVFFAGITKKNLNRGQWRYLSEKEVQFLKINN